MNRRTALMLAAGMPALAQDTKKPAGYRTSPVGYTDTPVIPGQKWKVHDIARPQPPQVTPAAKLGDPPSDAIVLFDGKDLSQWMQNYKKGPKKGTQAAADWKIENGYMECSRTGDLVTKQAFGDAQYHVEWSSPTAIDGDSQWRGNSGFLIMSRYEIQILDAWNNPTYADGMAASIYGQWPPMVSVAKKPGEWNVYDIFFEAPKFDGAKLVKPAYATIVWNGVLVHHHQELIGPMAHREVHPYRAHGAEEPLAIQDHDTSPRFRNIWVRRIKGYDQKS